MKFLKRLGRLPTLKVVVVSLALVALGVAMVGCDGSGGATTTTAGGTTPAGGGPTTGTTPGSPDTSTVVQATDLRGIISGKVVDSSTGQPIVNARVTAGAGVGSATTDSFGNFTLTNAFRTGIDTPIILTVTEASAPGKNYPDFSNAVISLHSNQTSSQAVGIGINPVEPTQTITNVEIELHDQNCFITGTLVDTFGRGLAGAVVTLRPVAIPVVTPGTTEANPTTGIFPFALTSVSTQPGGQLVGQTTATTDSAGKFTLANIPANWIYDITIIPGLGIPNVTFTNQYVPGVAGLNGATLPGVPVGACSMAFPDTTGMPNDSAVRNALNLAGVPGTLPATLVPACAGAPCGPFVPGAPVIVARPAADSIAPFVLSTSSVIDNTVIADAQNTAGLQFRIRFNEPLAQSNNVDQLLASIRLVYRGFTAPPVGGIPPFPALPAGEIIPIRITTEDNGATLVITPALQAGQRLAGGFYALTGLFSLTDVNGNRYTGLQPPGLAPCPPGPGCVDAANTADNTGDGVSDLDGTITFQVLEALSGAPVGAVTNIVCGAGSCNNGVTNFIVTFGAAAGAVQYFGGFATGQAPNTPLILTIGNDLSCDGILQPGELYSSAGPLVDPPRIVRYDLVDHCPPPPFSTGVPPATGVGVPVATQGFQFPLVVGTESNASIANNSFDDGASLIIAVEAQSMAGLRGPQAVGTVRDNTAPGLNTAAAGSAAAIAACAGLAAGALNCPNGNNYQLRLDPAAPGFALLAPGTMANAVTPFTFLDNLYSNTLNTADTMGDSIPFVEGPRPGTPGVPVPGTVGYDFTNVTMATAEGAGFPGTDIFYSAADYTAAGTVATSSITIAANEDLSGTPTAPTYTPAHVATLAGLFAATGAQLPGQAIASAAFNDGVTGSVTGAAIPNDGDAIRDENLITLTTGDPRNFQTGDSIGFTGAGITDEAANALTASVRIANGIPAAIISAVASVAGANHVLTLNFDRPITPQAGAITGGMFNPGFGLGLRNADFSFLAAAANLLTGTVAVAANERSLTVTVPVDFSMAMAGLADVTTNTVLDGTGLLTDDPLAFIAPGGTGAHFVPNPGAPLLGVNTFRVASGIGTGRAAILLTDQIPPRITGATDADFSPLNAALGGAANGDWENGDVAPDTYIVVLTFSEDVFTGTTAAELLASARAELTFTVAASAGTAVYTVSPDPTVSIPTAANPLGIISANMVAVQFDLTMGTIAVAGPPAELHTLSITMLSDLAGNPIDVTADAITLGVTGSAFGFTIN